MVSLKVATHDLPVLTLGLAVLGIAVGVIKYQIQRHVAPLASTGHFKMVLYSIGIRLIFIQDFIHIR